MAKATMVPTAAILLAPVTLLFGPIFSYNVVAVSSPALSAFTAYLLCRRLTKRELPALVGGLLFGFSAYEFGQLLGHLNLFVTFLIPVMVHITLRRVDRELSRRAYVVWMALLLALQMGLSTELLAESVMLGMLLLICAAFMAKEPYRGRVRTAIVETVIAGLVAVAITSPFLYYALISGGFPPSNPILANMYGLDLTNLVFPTLATWLGHGHFQALSATFEHGSVAESGGYLSVAILVAFATWFFSGARRSLLGKLVAITVVVSFVMALGAHLHVAGIETVAMPFDLVKSLPIFDNLVPSRIMLFATLAIAIGVAAWLAKSGGHARARWVLVLAGVVMLVPNVERGFYGVPPTNPTFFKTKLYRRYLARNEKVLVLPFGPNDISTLWQAETGFYFYMPEGYVSSEIPSPFNVEPGVAEMYSNVPLPSSSLVAFIRAHDVTHVIVDPGLAGPWPAALAQIGLHGRQVGGVLLYDVPRALSGVAARA